MFKLTHCGICGGELEDVVVAKVSRFREQVGTVVFEEVPVQQCRECKEQYLSAEVLEGMERVLRKGKPAPHTALVEVPAYPPNAYLIPA
ncbi:MAG: YgiT-type zinc finger protein [Armatimonadetes bacterium]|nr:YgiT-type zinc finger protein [Armatimonadota bacterium]